MKKTIFITLFFLSVSLLSCSNENNISRNDSVSGRWKLVKVTGTFGGINDNYTYGLVTWDFNPITQTVTVVNNNSNANLWDVLETGVYNYQFVNNPNSTCGESIEIDGTVFGCYSVVTDSLVIDQSIADGFAITLKR
ncbi:hypothetical protein [Flavobacterium sp.]|jgi:hypothetical protein|uniref:hypothetical protein n=1 Tax=Flavobacterium sp. TaxID=239 RepID=UPI0037C0EC3D